MFENITKFFRKFSNSEKNNVNNSKDAAKERLHLVLMQDRANVSADFLELMKQEIIEVIKKYIDVDENAIDVRLTNKDNGDGTTGAPALYANIPIRNIKNEARQVEVKKEEKKDEAQEQEMPKEENNKPKEEIGTEKKSKVNKDEKAINAEKNKVKQKEIEKKSKTETKEKVKSKK